MATFLNEQQLADMFGVTVRTIQQWRWSGRGPKFVRISRRCVRYREEDIDAFVAGRVVGSTSEECE